MTNDERNLARIRSSGLTSPSTFDIRLPRRSAAKPGTSTFGAGGAFTLIELLVVIAIIIVLTGLILSTVGYVQKKGARSRAETEIAAMSAALESYKADNGIYPRATATDNLDAKSNGDPSTYPNASLVLYRALSGDTNCDRAVNATDENFDISGNPLSPPLSAPPKTYFAFKPNQLSPTDQTLNVAFIRDPFGNSYGYSTANQFSSSTGYNPTFDLWSTNGLTSGTDPTQWIKNW
jgi:type II secretory pathway pseudopilin PulG